MAERSVKAKRSGIVGRAMSGYRALNARQLRLERWLERRYPKLYDARHAATGIGRALWPLLGPLLVALILAPIVALLFGLVALLGLIAPAIELPSIDLPAIPFPDVTPPGWLLAIGDAVSSVLQAVATPAKYLSLAALASLAYTAHARCGANASRPSSLAAPSSCGAWRSR